MNIRPLILALVVALPSGAQSIDSRVSSLRGSISFDFDTHDNVCGNGSSIYISEDTSPGWTTRQRRRGIQMGSSRSGDVWRCEVGPARVLLTRSGSTYTDVRVAVGGDAMKGDTEIGTVSAAEASRFLLTIAPSLAGRSADQAIMGAAVANTPSPWRRLLEIARMDNASESARKSSLFWVSQEASTVATKGLSDVAMDDSADGPVRSDALFYLAQRKDGEGIPSLIKVVQDSKSTKLKKDAIFYLSQSRDPRALDLFEKLLAGR